MYCQYQNIIVTIQKKAKNKNHLLQYMSHQTQQYKQQASKYMSKFEQKMQQFIIYQDNLISTQVEQMKSIIKENENKILQQKVAVNDLAEKIAAVEIRTQSRLLLLAKELDSFRGYYQQCYQYGIRRVNQVADRLGMYSEQVQKQIKSYSLAPVTEYLKYTHQLINNIVTATSLKSSNLKYQVQQQIYQLQLQISKYTKYLEQIESSVDEMKSVRFGNEGLDKNLRDFKGIIQRESGSGNAMGDSGCFSKKVIGGYQQKFKEILKRINVQSVQIQMLKLLMSPETKPQPESQQSSPKKQKNSSLYQQRILQLQSQIQQQKSLYEKNLGKKEQILKKRQQRILQLQDSLHSLLQKEVKTQHELAQLRLHNVELNKEVRRLEEEVKARLRNKESQASDKSGNNGKQQKKQGLEQKLLLLQIEYQNLHQKYKSQQQQLKQYQKNQRYLSQTTTITNNSTGSPTNLSTSLRNLKQVDPKLNRNINLNNLKDRQQFEPEPEGSRDRSKSKTKNKEVSNTKIGGRERTPTRSNLNINLSPKKSQTHTDSKQKIKLKFEIQKLSKKTSQLTKINKQLQDQIKYLINKKTKQNKQEQLYLDQFQEQLLKNSVEIERLQTLNLKLSRRNAELEAENQKLGIELDRQAQEFQYKVKGFKSAIYQLERKNDMLLREKGEEYLSDFNQNKSYISSKRLPTYTSSTSTKKLSQIQQQKSSAPIASTSSAPKQKQKRLKKVNNFLLQLQNAIVGMRLPTPIYIEIDKNGYIREHKTGNYLVDQNNNPIFLTQSELQAAIESELVII